MVVGYRVDNQEDDIIAVAPPDSLRHLPKEMIDVCKVRIEEFSLTDDFNALHVLYMFVSLLRQTL